MAGNHTEWQRLQWNNMIAYGPGEVRSLSLQVQEPPTIPHQPSYWTSSRSNQWTPFPGPSVKILQSPFLESQGTDIRLVLNLKPSFLDASSSEDGVQLPMHEGYSHMLWHGGEIIICSVCNHITLWNAFVNVQLHKPGPVPPPPPLPRTHLHPFQVFSWGTPQPTQADQSCWGAACKESSTTTKMRTKNKRTHTHTKPSNPGLLTFNLITHSRLSRVSCQEGGGTLLRNYPFPPNQGPQCQTTSWQPASSLTHGARGQLRIRESCGSPWTIPPSSSTKPNWCRSVTNCCLSLREGVVENVRLEKLTHSFRHCNPLSHRSSADKHHGTDEEEKR